MLKSQRMRIYVYMECILNSVIKFEPTNIFIWGLESVYDENCVSLLKYINNTWEISFFFFFEQLIKHLWLLEIHCSYIHQQYII